MLRGFYSNHKRELEGNKEDQAGRYDYYPEDMDVEEEHKKMKSILKKFESKKPSMEKMLDNSKLYIHNVNKNQVVVN
jgi:hypothetical protein